MVLNDGISGVLRKINTALNTTLNAFEQVQRASGRAVDTAQIQAARAALVEANREVDDMAEGYRRAAQQEEVLNKGLRNGTSAADGLLGKVKGIVATLAAGAGAKALLGLSDKLTSTTARLSFLVDDGGSVDELEQKIMASAQRSRAAYLDTASAIASMGANAGRAFESNDELIAFMEQVNKQFVIGGATAEGQSAAMLQLTQAMAAGALRGEELNSILENAPGIARAIESYMGVAEGSIKSYAEEGLITADVVKNALLSVADETNAKFESMPMTWAQICTKMQNTALAAFEPVLTRLNQVANSAQFNTVIDGAINGLAMLASVATGVLDLLINGASFVVDNWSWISPIVYGLVAAFIAYNAVALITNGINAAMALAEGVKAAALMMSTGATFAQTAAQYGLNAALAACPITWIVVAVIALVAAIYAACSAIAKFTGIANSGFGVIAGGINVVIQFFVNLGLTVANIALGIWNALGACAQNIGIAFSNVISGVQSWFYNLLSTALTVVAGICEALNKLPFVEFDYRVRSYDSYNATSTYVTSETRTVDNNAIPVITSSTTSGTDLGTKEDGFDLTYTVTDADSDTVTVKEYLDNVLKRTYTATLGQSNTVQCVTAANWQKVLNGAHTIKVVANDTKADSTPYTVTFTKAVYEASITLAEPMDADDAITVMVLNVLGSIPADADLEVLVTNNANDTEPVWEDATQDVKNGNNHVFTNQTAANGFAFNFKVNVGRGASNTGGYITSIGGAFQ